MPNEKLRICLPWNTRNYVTVNAFHPLYSFLIQNSIGNTSKQSYSFDLVTLLEKAWQDYLSKSDTKETVLLHIQSVYINNLFIKSKEFHDFWRFFDIKETIADELSDYHFKIVHTSLLTCNLKPYVYHLESFETLFFPWQIENPLLKNVSSAKITAIKKYLQTILENPLCLAIVSHVPLTINCFKTFFESSIINEKLHFSPLGVSCPAKLPVKKCPDRSRRFIFSTSLHGNIDNLTARGAVAFILFVHQWKQLFPQDHFVFLSNEPGYDTLSSFLSKALYDDVILYENVIFTGGKYANNDEFSKLLSSADYIFLLTYQLHSLSLLKSMSYGVIPIVIDLPEIVDYGINDNNAVILRCYEKLEFINNPIFGTSPTLDSFVKQTRAGIPYLVNKLHQLRKQPDLEETIAYNAFVTVDTKFNPDVALRNLSDIMLTSYKILNTKKSSLPDIKQTVFRGETLWGSIDYFLPPLRLVEINDFDRRATYHEIISIGGRSIYGDGRHYVELPHHCDYIAADLERFSFRSNEGLHRIGQANLSYENALDTMFLTMTVSWRYILRVQLKKIILYHPTLKKYLQPAHRLYKKIKSLIS